MAEILVKAVSASHLADPEKDQRGCYKRGMPVTVKPDGHPWGLRERLPKFVVIRIPLILSSRVAKYIEPAVQGVGEARAVVRRRLWRLRWADLPTRARNRLQNDGELIIKATDAYTGTFDYTWAQVKDYFLNQQTGLNETEDL